MVSLPQFGVSVPLASMHAPVRLGAIRTPDYRLDTRAIVSALVGDNDVLSSGTSLLGRTSALEVALITVLFLLVSSLVAIRVAEGLSDRDINLAALQSRSAIANGSSEPDQRRGTDRSPTDDHQSFDRYIAPDTPSVLLSDEGEVVRLLVANDGRLRQHRIADETDWSKSKVSRLCSQLDADGIIEKVSVGRENVITLSDPSADDSTETDDVENPVA
ncbi:hypothetical protein C477_20764 [Haloterrigena salina JCM 13891]|uniref:DUF7343 domain-containing protein n=1 Tax=Haloterrigena salina JCM 13891 TaxID=1227488 RepID=M0BUI6_9EURY|nr:hypothetical protein C477_20764 [Haloterrigena salina JCM 13891]